MANEAELEGIMTTWHQFDHEPLEPLEDDPGMQNRLVPILPRLAPPTDAKPTLAETNGQLYVAWPVAAGTVGVRFADCFLHRHGFPDPSFARSGLKWPNGRAELGLFYVPQSDLRREPQNSWIGRPLPLAESFGLQHFVASFGSSLLECLCHRIEYFVEIQAPPRQVVGGLLNDD